MTETTESKTLTDKEIIEKLLNGASLRTFMIPDESIPSNYPEHIETYDLPHIVISGDYFWGKSETAHLIHTLGSIDTGVIAFCYTNISNIFGSYNPTTCGIRFMNKKRYKQHSWNLRENYRLIWDSERYDSAKGIRQEIELCSKFKIALLDSEDIWNIHPVDLPMYYTGKEDFDLKTASDFYPILFRYPSEIEKLIDKFSDLFDEKSIDNSKVLRLEYQKFPTFYSIRSDGTYYNGFDIPRKTIQKYKRLKVFVDSF